MEVASPLTFGSAGTKRHYPGSPPAFGDPSRSFNMMDASGSSISGEPNNEFAQQSRAFKRRRFTANDDNPMESDNTENSQNHAFPSHAMVARGPFSTPVFKRSRTESSSHSQHGGEDLRKIVDSQAAEIHSLKSEKAGLENSFNALKGEHDKVVYENKTLKRAVLIQQERQNHASSQLEAAQQYKAEAEDKIKKLEQLVLSLRYHLQAQQNNTPTNDFMGFPPRPPDVY